jgi:hypothetical protein
MEGMTKAQARQSRKKDSYYQRQFNRTAANKARRALKRKKRRQLWAARK